MRRVNLATLIFICVQFSFGQLSGIKTIPGNYATIAAAVTDLNAQGVGSGGVTFDVSAGHSENITAPITVTATGTSSNPIVFKKSGAGSNPSVTRTDAGTITTSIFGSSGDAVIRLEGTDYFTWQQINLNASNQGIEYGFLTFKPNGTDGCQSVTVLQSVITMTKGTSGNVVGIYISNGPTSVSSATGVTVSSLSGRNYNINLNGNTVQNVHSGIYCQGANSALYPDETITVGLFNNGNNIKNFGGGNTSAANGIYFNYISNPTVGYNDIDNQAGGGSPHGGYFYGIRFQNARGEVICSDNAITVSNNSALSDVHYIYLSNIVTSMIIDGNFFAGNTLTSTGMLYFIRTTGSTEYTSISSNNTYGPITRTGGHTYFIMNAPLTGTTFEGYEIIENNSFTQFTINSGDRLLYGIYSNADPDTRECNNNLISELAHNGTGPVYGLVLVNADFNQISANTIENITGNGDVEGLVFTGDNPGVFSNIIKNISTSGAYITGIKCGGIMSTNCYRNQVFNLTSTYSSPTIVGMYIQSGILNRVHNNFISDLKAPSASGTRPIVGINVYGGTNAEVFYNTVYLNASSSGSTFGTAGIYTTGNPVLTLRNNIIVNLSTPAGTSGYTIAFESLGYTLENYSIYSNCNNFYAGTPGPKRLIFDNASNAIQTLDAYKAFVNTRDGASITENPPFVNGVTPPYNLHLQTTVATQCESGGIPVTSPISINYDFDGNTRNGTVPDIGADEFAGIKTDIIPPAISLTPLPRTATTGNRTLTAFISDASGVPTTGTGLPKLYWRVNGGSYIGIQATYISGRRYDFSFGGGVSLNDVIDYYIVAQDLSGTPLTGSYPVRDAAGFTTNPPACSTPPSLPYTYTIVGSISSPVTVGTGGDYPSLTGPGGFFADINARIVNQNITATVISDLVENGANGLNQWMEEGTGNYTLTIKPDGTTIRNISGNHADGLIRLNGADRVIFDGRFNGSGNYLRFSNTSTSTTTAVIHIASLGIGAGAENNTIRNCMISGGTDANGRAFGVYISSELIEINNQGADNDYLSILQNTISHCDYAIFARGLQEYGPLDELFITDNIIGSEVLTDTVKFRGIDIGIAEGPVISDNLIFNIRTVSLKTNAGIFIGTFVNDAVITGNQIHGLSSTNLDGWGTYGIEISSSSTSNIIIANNLIYDLVTFGYGSDNTYNPFGIRINGGTGHKVYYNTILMNGAFLDPTQNNRSAAILISSALSAGIDLRNNILVNSMTGSSGQSSYAIFTTSVTAFNYINNNNYSVSGPNGTLGYFGSNITTLAGWQAVTGQDANSISADPQFTGTDLHLLNPSSPCIGNAAPVTAITDDHSGDPRHLSHPTMGAYEYIPVNNWLGNSISWNVGSNWSRNLIPDDTYGVIIPASPAGGNFPVVPPGNFDCYSIRIETGASLNVQGTLEVKSANL